jgi:hypothetical protein
MSNRQRVNKSSENHAAPSFGRAAKRGLAIIATAAALAIPAAAQNVHWLTDGAPLTPAVLPSMFLSDANVAQVDQFLAGQSGPKVLKIPADVSAATVSAIYDKYKIDYTFADLEGADAVARTTALVSQIKASATTGPAVTANKAFVGNFNFQPIFKDPTAPNAPTNGYADYSSAGLNMATESLYPGAPSYRNPASGDSDAPNVRSALFTLPIARLSMTTASLPGAHAHIPYVNRFNNWGNDALDTDHDASNGYQFVTSNQLPSRGDFQAQILHYRLRGANGVHGLDGGVVGYTPAQFEQDIQAGWSGTPAVNDVLSDPKARLATLDTVVKADGLVQSMEQAGVVISGAYSAAKAKLVVLMSNLDEKQHKVELPNVIGGKAVSGEFLIAAGSHQILQFNASGTRWDLQSIASAFQDDDRSGVGVPEPTALTFAGAATFLCTRRKRRRPARSPQ